MRVGLRRAGDRCYIYLECAGSAQNARAFRNRGASGEHIVHDQDLPASDLLRPDHGDCPTDIFAPPCEPGLRLGFAPPFQNSECSPSRAWLANRQAGNIV